MKILFAGTPDFSVPTLQALIDSPYDVCGVYTQPDRPAGRGRQPHASPVKTLAQRHGIEVQQPLNFRDPQALNTLQAYQADLMVVVAYGLILPESVLNTPRFGCINIHASLLPRWRGAAPIQRAIQAGDPVSGICLMQMDAGLDTGDVLKRVSCPLTVDETGQSLHDKLALMGAAALLELLPDVAKQTLQPKPQSNDQATYASKLSKAEAEINWQQSATQIERQIRAFNPWPVAFSTLNQQAVRFWSAHAEPTGGRSHPGQISVDGKQLWVDCGSGSRLQVLELQPAGKKRMTTEAYLAAHRPDGHSFVSSQA